MFFPWNRVIWRINVKAKDSKVNFNVNFFSFTNFFIIFADGGLHAVYDVTLGYPDIVPETEQDLMDGNFPNEVHFHIKRFVCKLFN